jgi:hypothetical protein
VREIPFRDGSGSEILRLCIAAEEETIWLWERRNGINHPVPLTNFHNELMLHLRIRDPKIVHAPKDFYRGHAAYGDNDLRAAFVRYNSVWKKATLREGDLPAEETRARGGIRKLFTGKES